VRYRAIVIVLLVTGLGSAGVSLFDMLSGFAAQGEWVSLSGNIFEYHNAFIQTTDFMAICLAFFLTDHSTPMTFIALKEWSAL
jgi:hypothetical protein